jgi:diacylglycerol kinase (ATP)
MPYQPPPRSWLKKFADAFGGIAAGAIGESSFYVHVPVAIAVAALGWYLQVTRIEACLLALCITIVISAELMNSALERLARAMTDEYSDEVRIGLNIASGAVLCVAIGAAIVGAIIFVPRLVALLGY